MEVAKESKGSRLIMGTMRLGAWGAQFTTDQYIEFIEHCLELGVSSFDLADIYGDYSQERDFGAALKARPDLRERIEIITKCGICRVCDARPQYEVKHYDTSPDHIFHSVENSLNELGTGYVDMLLLHRPDFLMDADDVAKIFTRLRQIGYVREFGVSNFTPFQFNLLNDRFTLATNQIELSLLQLDPFQDGSLDQAQALKFQPQAWSPFGGGSFFQADPDEQIQRIKAVADDLGKRYGASLDQLLLAFLLRHPSIIRPVLGTTKIERVKSAVEAQAIELSREDWYRLWTASTGKRVP